ncbi:MAG: hypothetical protein ABEH81_01375 [Halopenitus sp.]
MKEDTIYKVVGALSAFFMIGPIRVIITESTPTERVLALVVTIYLIVTVVFMLGLLLSGEDEPT